MKRNTVETGALHLCGLLSFALLATVVTFAQVSPPAVVGSVGYINGTSLTVHTSSAFNSSGASTLVVFVSTNTPWNGLTVRIGGVTDNLGNTWNLLTGPTPFSGSSFPMLSAIYYVNGAATSATHTLTVQLSNPAPLVFHVFAISGSDVSGPPIFSPITDPGTGGTSANVTTAPITVPANSLLLSWVKNETSATATAMNGYTLDAGQSSSFLWAESQSPISSGTYTGVFQYNAAIGWQTAVLGLQPATGPVALGQSVITDQDTPVDITLAATSPLGFPLTYGVVTPPTHGTLSGSAPSLTYTPSAGYVGHDVFTFKANDGATDSNVATVSITVRGPAPISVSSVGYLNGTPLTLHTSTAFNSIGASTLVAFVSSHPTWNGLPVSIGGMTDNLGNTWNVLTGPTSFPGSAFTLLSEIYYVNSPATSATHTITVQLTNPAPLVFHVFAVSGSDVSVPPIFSPITDPGAGLASTNVTTAPITVPADSLLLGWVKNESSATASAQNGYTLDGAESTSFLWAESQSPIGAGSYTGDFLYSSPIGWQAAVLGLQPRNRGIPTPVLGSTPPNPTNQTSASFSFSDSQAGVTFLCSLDGSAFGACASPQTYSGLGESSHTFSVKAQDASSNQSTATTFTWTVDLTPPPIPTINSTPANPTNQTSASFSFTDSQAGVTFLCSLDGGAFSACSSSQSYSGLSQTSHTFSVEAQDAAGNPSSAATFNWTIDTTPPPVPSITSTPANPTNQTSASFSFTDSEGGVTFLCRIDGSAFSVCSSPKTYSGLSQSSHTFSVEAQDAAGNPSSAATFSWTVDTTAAAPTITSKPANPTNQTSASFSFTDTEAGVTFFCSRDGSAFSVCASPTTYSALLPGSHTFSVNAQDIAGNISSTTTYLWVIDIVPPPVPTIISAPAFVTKQNSASFKFTDLEAGVSYWCQLDGSAFSSCSSPENYNKLRVGAHTFAVKAQDRAGNRSGAASYTWTIR